MIKNNKTKKELTSRLAEGENCLVQCVAGNGRAGMVIAGVVKNVGVKGL